MQLSLEIEHLSHCISHFSETNSVVPSLFVTSLGKLPSLDFIQKGGIKPEFEHSKQSPLESQVLQVEILH